MLLDLFIKKYFISFIEEKEGYKVLKEIVKKKSVIQKESYTFDKKEDLKKFLNQNIQDNPQTYISSILTTLNQGLTPTCEKHKLLQEGLELKNLEIICIKNLYSFYTSKYEIENLKKEFPLDFIYSIFAPIDKYAKKRHNILYLLTLEKNLAFIIYYDEIPKYADITEIEDNEEEMENIEDIEEILDIEEDIIEIDDEIEEESNIEQLNIEKKIIDFLKEGIKEYYQTYSTDFIEKIIILDTLNINKEIKKSVEEELIIETEIEKFDILSQINLLSREDV